MSHQPSSLRARLPRLIATAVVAATCVQVWFGPRQVLPRAEAQIPDSGLQRKRMIDEVQRTNELLEQINHTLKTQTIKVRVETTDKPKSKAPPPPRH